MALDPGLRRHPVARVRIRVVAAEAGDHDGGVEAGRCRELWKACKANGVGQVGSIAISCEVVEADPPKKLVHTFGFPGSDESSRCTWSIEARGETSLLTLVHDGFASETETYKSVAHGWVPILSGMKTLLETGKPLEISYPVAEGVRD